jgi:hypothetical protein
VVARFLTPQLSALTGGLACLLATALIAVLVPDVRRYRANPAKRAPLHDRAVARAGSPANRDA